MPTMRKDRDKDTSAREPRLRLLPFDRDVLGEIWSSIERNRSRSLLTGFGVFWGIFMLLTLMGAGDGLRAILQAELQGFATNSGFIVADRTSKPYKGLSRDRSWEMNTGDIARIRSAIPEVQTVTGVLTVWGQSAMYGENTSSCQAKGVFPEYARIEEPSLRYGRYINRVDVDQERKVCVIGKRVYRDLFPGGGDPCGEYIKFGDSYYKVVGVDMSSGNISINGSADRAVTIPASVVQKLYNKGDNVDLICMVAKPGCKIKSILSQCRGIMARAHLFDPTDKKALVEINVEEMFGIIDNLFRGINILIWLVGFGTLLAATIGVSNIMMVTVKERTVEIGIRRAIGATPQMILSQIMSESVILTIMAGLGGVILSVMLLSGADILARNADIPPVSFQVSFSMAMLALLILAFLGVLAGLPPSLRAMAIRPVDAMRDE